MDVFPLLLECEINTMKMNISSAESPFFCLLLNHSKHKMQMFPLLATQALTTQSPPECSIQNLFEYSTTSYLGKTEWPGMDKQNCTKQGKCNTMQDQD